MKINTTIVTAVLGFCGYVGSVNADCPTQTSTSRIEPGFQYVQMAIDAACWKLYQRCQTKNKNYIMNCSGERNGDNVTITYSCCPPDSSLK